MRSNVLGGTGFSGEQRRGSAAQDPGREISRKVVLRAVITTVCPSFLPIPIWNRLLSSWTVSLLCILEEENVPYECLGEGGGRKEDCTISEGNCPI